MRKHLTYANVVATLALFSALGGGAYAATRITGRDVVDGSLSGVDVRNGSLTGNDVRDASLLARDFRPGQLPRGATGAQGPAGPQGAAGPQGVPGTARAFAVVNADGTLAPGAKGVVSSRREQSGLSTFYCVRFDFAPTVILATPTTITAAAIPATVTASADDLGSCPFAGERRVTAFVPNGLPTSVSFAVMAN
jgi:hypothetical protein